MPDFDFIHPASHFTSAGIAQARPIGLCVQMKEKDVPLRKSRLMPVLRLIIIAQHLAQPPGKCPSVADVARMMAGELHHGCSETLCHCGRAAVTQVRSTYGLSIRKKISAINLWPR